MHHPKTWLRGFVLIAVALGVLALPSAAGAKPADRDHDGMADRWEHKHRVSSAASDPDDDGLSNRSEYRAHTDPRDYDTDSDRTEDGDEDPDRDRVDNGTEQDARTHPRKRDSDRDGRRDGREDRDRDRLDNAGESLTEHDAGDPDTDGDGVEDGDEVAGTILEITDDGLVTIKLARGGSLSGFVGPHTDFGCDGFEDEDEDLALQGDPSGDTLRAERGLPGSGDADELDEDELDEAFDEDKLDDEDELDDEELDEDEDDLDDEPTVCSLEDLEEGMLVHEAELRVTGDGTLIEEIEVVG